MTSLILPKLGRANNTADVSRRAIIISDSHGRE
jgi:hypothetical protein